VSPDLKSRLVGRAGLEGIDGLRTDSPTAEIENVSLLNAMPVVLFSFVWPEAWFTIFKSLTVALFTTHCVILTS